MLDIDRIIELRRKKASLKSKRLGKKESEELRGLVKKNCRMFLITTFSPEETKDVEDILKKESIHHEKVIMPETIDLKFF